MEIKWNFELNVIKEYLSRFYRSDFACIREYVANAIAAQHRAGVSYPVVNDPVYVEISPERIVIEDKGVGISRQKFKEVFMWFGRSENREVEGVQGRFGLGAKSFMMLTGDTGKVVMRTRSREADEAYSAVLTSTGAEIVDDGGKDDYGTRFEIYPEKPLTAEKVEEFYSGVASHFDFSRIPVRVKACADEPFSVYITGHELNVVRDSKDGEDSTLRRTEKVKEVEAIFGVQNHEIEILEYNEVYELGVLKTRPYHELRWWRDSRTAVVLGDVLVDKAVSAKRFFFRIKVEDGRETEILGVKVRTPEPLPNRDDYRGLDEFIRLVRLQHRTEDFKKEGYDKYLNVSPADLASLGGFLKDLRRAVDRVKEIARDWQKYDEELLQAVERALPGFTKLDKTLQILLTELPAYGSWGYVESNGRRRTVTVAEVLNARYVFNRNVGYVRRRPSRRKELVMDEEGVCAVYTENNTAIEFLKKNGIKEVNVRDGKTRVKVYTSVWNGFEGGDAEYMGFDRLIYGWNGEVFVYAGKVSELKGRHLPACRVVIGSKNLYRKLKEVFGDFVMTYNEWLKFVFDTTLVTDGYEVTTLSSLCGTVTGTETGTKTRIGTETGTGIRTGTRTGTSGETCRFVETYHTALLPALERVMGFRILAFVDATAYTHARDILGARKLEDWFRDWCNESPSWRIASMAERVNRESAEALHLVLMHGRNYNSIFNDLVEIVYRYAGVGKGKEMEELKKLAAPVVEKIVEKYGTLKLGKFPVKAFMYRGPVEKGDLDGLTAEGVRLVNPFIPSFTYDLAGKAGDEIRKLQELQQRFRPFGALIYHAEKGGVLNSGSGKTKVSAREVVEKYLPSFARSKEDWELLVRLAPRVSKKIALSTLL